MSFLERDPSNSILSCLARSTRWKVDSLPVVVRLKDTAWAKASSNEVGW